MTKFSADVALAVAVLEAKGLLMGHEDDKEPELVKAARDRLGANDTQFSIGKLIGEDRGRDAVHIALAPVRVKTAVHPGQGVGLVPGTKGLAVDPTCKPLVGIIDPFLEWSVPQGERCWLFLYPNTVESLQHKWRHYAFDDISQPEIEADSEAWLRAYAEVEADITYSDLMQSAKYWLEGNDLRIDGGKFEGIRFPQVFWDHYENVTGEKVPQDKRHSFFSCAC